VFAEVRSFDGELAVFIHVDRGREISGSAIEFQVTAGLRYLHLHMLTAPGIIRRSFTAPLRWQRSGSNHRPNAQGK
jgi:hypothetical protein